MQMKVIKKSDVRKAADVCSEAQKIFWRDLCEMHLWADFERWLALIAGRPSSYIHVYRDGPRCGEHLSRHKTTQKAQPLGASTEIILHAEDNLSGNLRAQANRLPCEMCL